MISHGSPECEPIILEARRLRIEEKCQQLYAEGTRVLLCGAMSHQWRDYLQQLGIQVHAFLAGNAHEIMHAYFQGGEGGLDRYAMPGCKGNRRGRQRRRLGRGPHNACEFHQLLKE